MIYTTGGMRVARVSVVDGDGKEVFDKCVKMDEGVHVMLVFSLPSVSPRPSFSLRHGFTETLTPGSRVSLQRCIPRLLYNLLWKSGDR